MVTRAMKLPKLGWVVFRKARNGTEPPGRLLSVTVSRSPSGKYFASVVVENEVQEFLVTNNKIGIDLGIKDYAIFSDGTVIPNPKHLDNLLAKLRKAQKKAIP